MNTPNLLETIDNFVYDEISLGQTARTVRTLTLDDIQAFAAVSGDTNPAHLDPEYANATLFHGIIAHGMWGGALISALLGTVFPGPGTIYLHQALHFCRPVRVGDTVRAEVTITAIDRLRRRVTFATACKVGGKSVLEGEAVTVVPRRPAPAA